MELVGTISRIMPKRGRGPGIIVVTPSQVGEDAKPEPVELSTFDPDIIRIAVGAQGTEAKITYEEKPSKDGSRTYRNLVSLEVESDSRLLSNPNAEGGLGGENETLVPAPLSPYRAPSQLAKNDPNPYILFDRADDEAILAKLKGAVLESIVYCFKQQGQMVYGLGVDGAQACKRELAREGEVIEEEEVNLIKEDNVSAYFEARASRWAVNKQTGTRIKLDSALGFKNQSKIQPSGTRNPFWYESGASKAMRNAILRLTPEGVKMRLIEMYKEHAKEVG